MTRAGLGYDPRNSRALLIGTSTYADAPGDGWPPVPAAERNVQVLAELLTSAEIAGFPKENIRTILDPDNPGQVLDELYSTGQEASDLLILYIVGHAKPRYSELYLGLRKSTQEGVHRNGLAWSSVALTLQEINLPKTTCIFIDCCFSGLALDNLGADTDSMNAVIHKSTQEIRHRGGLVAVSASSETSTAKAPVGEPHTAFGGALIETLRQGSAEVASEGLDVDFIVDKLHNQLVDDGFPRPQVLRRGQIGDFVLARNVAFGADRKPSPPRLDHAPATEALPLDWQLDSTPLRDPGTLAAAGAFIAAVSPAITATGDVGPLRGSISQYWDVEPAARHYVPLGLAGVLILLAGLMSALSKTRVNRHRWFNVPLGQSLLLMTWFNVDESPTIHYAATFTFYTLSICLMTYTAVLGMTGRHLGPHAVAHQFHRSQSAYLFTILWIVLSLLILWQISIVSFFFFESLALIAFAMYHFRDAQSPFPYGLYEFSWPSVNEVARALRIMPPRPNR